MPGFDGTGPRGQGPLTGRGEGYCGVRLPDEAGQPAYGDTRLQGTPTSAGAPGARPTFGLRFFRRLGRGFRMGRRQGRGRGRRAW